MNSGAVLRNEDISTESEVVQKKSKKTCGQNDKPNEEYMEVETTSRQMMEPFSVDMSRILRSTGDDGIATVHDIQQLLLFSLLGPENNRSLPQWAKLNHKCVKKVVVVLLKYVTPTLFDKNEDCFMKIGCMFDCVFPYKNYGDLVFIQSPAQSLLMVALPKQKGGNLETEQKKSAKCFDKRDYVLTEQQLIKNDFLIPGLSQDAQDFFTIPNGTKNIMKATKSSQMFSLDCEMCMSERGRELTRISVVDQCHEVVYDSLVKPELPITDYLTRFSGITEEDLRGVETTLKDVQEKLKEIIPPNAILVGHSLEFDFASLQFFHNKVIDTSVIYGDGRGAGFKPGLKYLAKKFLKTVIQDDPSGHCSIEDAKTCMNLVQLKINKGPEFGKKNVRTKESVFDLLSKKSTKRGVMIDRESNIKLCGGSSDSAVACTTDEQIADNVIKRLPSYDFILSQLHNMDSIKRQNKDDKVKPILQSMDTTISEIHENLPDGTLFVVILGSADTSTMKRLKEQRASKKAIKKAEKEAKRGLCFMKLVSKSQKDLDSCSGECSVDLMQ